MANNIEFKIGSSFSGEGFTKAQGAVKSMCGEVNVAKEAMMKITGAIGGMDAAASKSLNAITGLLNGFGKLNPVMLGISAVTSALSWGISKVNEYQAAAKERADALHASLSKIKNDFGEGFIKGVVNETKTLTDQFNAIAKAASAMTGAMNSLSSTEGKGDIVKLQVEKLQASFNAVDENARALSNAYYDTEIALRKEQLAIETAEANNNAANEAVNSLQERVTILDAGLKKYNDEIAAINSQIESNYGDEKLVGALMKERGKIEAKRNEMAAQEEAVRGELRVALVKQKETLEAGRQSVELAANEAAATTEAGVKLQESLELRAENERVAAEEAATDAAIAADKREQEQKMRDELAADEKELKEITDKAKEARQNLAKAETEYKAALDTYRENLANNLMTQVVSGDISNQDYVNGMTQEAVRKGLENGTIRNSRQQADAEKSAARAARDALSSNEALQERRDQAAADRINKISPKARSKQDQDFLDKFNARQKAKEAQKKALEDAEKKKQQAEQDAKDAAAAQKAIAADVSEIKNKLTNLGLS